MGKTIGAHLTSGPRESFRSARGVVRCFVDSQELRRLLGNVAAAELARAMVRAALRVP